MDASEAMLPTVRTLPFSSSCSLPSSRFPSTSLASRSLDSSSICSSSGSIEIQYPTISQIIDSSTPLSFSSQPISFRATASSSSTALEPKFDYLPGVSNSSLKSPTTSGKSSLHASVIVDTPKPLESLQSSSIPPFLYKTYEIVNDPSLDRVISWTPAGQSFVVCDPVEFSRIVLPRHFKHSNFSSFLRQLNTYGFRKIDGDRWEFANEDFLRGKRSSLKNINRRRSPRAQPKAPYLGSSMAIELLGAEDELQELRGQKHIMMQEVEKMKHEHLVNIEKMDKLNCRLLSAESRQKQMMSFWLKVLRNPNFLMQLRQKRKLRQIASSSLEPEQQIAKNSQSFREPGSTFVLQGLESSSETQLNASSKGKNMPISSPEEFCSNKMAVEPLSKSSAPQCLQIDTFNGESVGNFTSEFDLWDNIFCANSVAPGEEIGMWDSGLHSDEAFDLDKCFFSEFPLLPDMDEDGRRDDDPESLEN